MVEQIHISCNLCKQVFNEVLEEAKKYSKSNPFICHLCLKPRESPSQKMAEPDLPAHSRQNDSRTFNDPDVNAAIERERRDKVHIHIPIFHHPNHTSDSANPPPPPDTLEHYESIATGPIKEKMEEFKARRERIERELEEEQVRTNRYANYDYDYEGGHNYLGIIIGIAMVVIFSVVFIVPLFGGMSSSIFSSPLSSALSTLDCNTLNGNAGPHQTLDNATGSARECLLLKTSTNAVNPIMSLLPVMMITMVMFLVIRIVIGFI